MIYILDAIYIVLSLFFMGGRIFELLNYTDLSNGYMTYRGVVSNPITIILLVVIAFCCSMIIFPFKEEQHPRMKFSIRIPGFVAGVLYMAGAVVNIILIFKIGGFLGFDIAVIIGGMALLFFSMVDIKARKIEKLPFVAVMLIPMAFIVRNLLFNVYSISNTILTQKNIAYMLTFLFWMLVFKNAYAPTRHSDTALYTVALLNFAFSFAEMLALIIVQTMKIGVQWNDIFSDLGFVVTGLISIVTVYNLNSKSKMFNYEEEEDIEQIHEIKEVSSNNFFEHSFATERKIESESEHDTTKITFKGDGTKSSSTKKVVYKADK